MDGRLSSPVGFPTVSAVQLQGGDLAGSFQELHNDAQIGQWPQL